MIDNRTANLNLPLPDPANLMKSEDVPRIIAALNAIDAAIFAKASTADITAAINALLAGAPAALDTLNELAAAINDDASFAASVTTALAGKANVTHTHSMSDIVGLLTALAAKLETVPKATPSVMGGFKLGSGFVQDIDGTLSVASSGGGSGLPAWADQVFTPTASQTTFTVSGGYVAGQIDVQLNGVTLIGNGDDYTAANGTTVVLTTGANTTDKLVVRKWFYLPSANAVNKAGDTLTGAINEAHGADIASASTINLNVATGNLVDVTGTTAITAITLADGAERMVRFTGALTLTNGANLVLPGGANITTAAGDFAIFRGYAAGVVRCAVYSRANGQAIVAGGGFTGGTMSSSINFAPTATVASAATTDIGAATSNDVSITGTATITALGTIAAGAERTVTFAAALTLTHNGTSLILPGAANILTAAGDVAVFSSLGSGNWRCTNYQRASAQPLCDARSADVASAATINLTTGSGKVVDVTGTTTITAITMADGAERVVRFTGALTLTNGASLVLPSGANITTAAGDFATFRGYAAGVVRCVSYTRANGQAVVSAGGFTGGTLTSALNYATTATIASAATTDIGAATSNDISVTGTTTITALGTIAAGAERTVTFAGALTLTHNATSLILPGAANITTAAGDVAVFISLGSGNWRCKSYQRQSGRPIAEQAVVDWQKMVVLTATGSTTVPAGATRARAYAIGKGGDGAAVTTSAYFSGGGGGGGCAWGEFAVTPGSSISVTIGASTTVDYSATTLLTANQGATPGGGAGGVGGSASKHVSVTNGGNATGGAGGSGTSAGNGGGGGSAGSPLGAGQVGGARSGGGGGIGGAGGAGLNATTGKGGGGGGAGGAGAAGTTNIGGAGGGAGGPANEGVGGQARTLSNFYTDPLLKHMTECGAPILSSTSYGVSAGQGGGGSGTSAGNLSAGHGGDGAGGGGVGGFTGHGINVNGGNGGLLGGGGGCSYPATGFTATGGYGGIGGGGGGVGGAASGVGTQVAGLGGSGAVFIFYS